MNLNVAIIGHVDHGKSTLIGRLLYDSENIKKGRLQEIQKLAQEYKKKFEFAYFLDAFDDELKEERTIDTTGVMFKSKNYYTITDVPGHKEFIKNMLTGASHADLAVLVVSASEGVQEQTRRHSFLATKMLGIKKIVVAINKMDKVGYRKEKFDEVKEKVEKLCTSFGHPDVLCIPISAMEGDNIYKSSKNIGWYRGPTLIQILDEMELEEKQRILRFSVQGNFSVDSEEMILGRVESGNLRKGQQIVFEPSGKKQKIGKIKVFEGEKEFAAEKESVGLLLQQRVERGEVGGDPANPPSAVEDFLGEAVLLSGSVKKGDALTLKCGTAKVRARVENILQKIDSETGDLLEKDPTNIDEGDAAVIHFHTSPLVVEKFSHIPELGRFVLVRNYQNIAAGIILETSVT